VKKSKIPELQAGIDAAGGELQRAGAGGAMSIVSNKQVGDGTGSGATVRACVKGSNKQVDDGTGNGTTVRACNQALSHCITCKMVPRNRGSDKCSQQSVSASSRSSLAVMAAFFGT
jgi:hypothetical protein